MQIGAPVGEQAPLDPALPTACPAIPRRLPVILRRRAPPSPPGCRLRTPRAPCRRPCAVSGRPTRPAVGHAPSPSPDAPRRCRRPCAIAASRSPTPQRKKSAGFWQHSTDVRSSLHQKGCLPPLETKKRLIYATAYPFMLRKIFFREPSHRQGCVLPFVVAKNGTYFFSGGVLVIESLLRAGSWGSKAFSEQASGTESHFPKRAWGTGSFPQAGLGNRGALPQTGLGE